MFGDCHVHMVLDGVEYRRALDLHRNGPQEMWVRGLLSAYAQAGISFLRDGGDRFGATRLAREIAAEYGIDYRTPLFPICRKGRYGAFIGRTFSDFGEYRALVDEVIAQGGDFIKIMISGLMDFDHFGVITSQPLEKDEIADMIAYAHDRGMAVMAHANGARTIEAAVAAGVDSIEHGAYMDAECVARLAESRTVWTPTLSTIRNLIGCGRFPDEVLRPLFAYQQEMVRACHKAGGCIASGSDCGAYRVPHVQGSFDETEILRQTLGEAADAAILEGENRIKNRFCR